MGCNCFPDQHYLPYNQSQKIWMFYVTWNSTLLTESYSGPSLMVWSTRGSLILGSYSCEVVQTKLLTSDTVISCNTFDKNKLQTTSSRSQKHSCSNTSHFCLCRLSSGKYRMFSNVLTFLGDPPNPGTHWWNTRCFNFENSLYSIKRKTQILVILVTGECSAISPDFQS